MAYTVTRSNPVERLQIAGLLKAGLDPYDGSRRCFQQLLEAEENLRSSQIRHHFNLYTMMRSYLDTPGDLYAYAIFCTRRLRSRYWREYMALVQNDWEELGSFDLGCVYLQDTLKKSKYTNIHFPNRNSLAVPYAAPSVAASAVVAIPASAQVHNLPAPASWYDSDGIPHLPAPARSLYPPVAWTGSGHDLRFPTLSADTFAPTASSGAAQALRLPAASALPVASTSRPAPRQLNLLPGLEETPISTEDFVRRLRSSMQMD